MKLSRWLLKGVASLAIGLVAASGVSSTAASAMDPQTSGSNYFVSDYYYIYSDGMAPNKSAKGEYNYGNNDTHAPYYLIDKVTDQYLVVTLFMSVLVAWSLDLIHRLLLGFLTNTSKLYLGVSVPGWNGPTEVSGALLELSTQ